MKKLLNMLGIITLTTLATSSATACHGFIPGSNPNPNPPPLIAPDIPYYQQLITNITKQIATIKQDIEEMNSPEMKAQICGANIMCHDLQQLIDSSSAELKQLQSQIQDYNYQILLLESNGHFTEEQKLQAITYLKSQLLLLTAKRILMLKVPDYTDSDFTKVDKQIVWINNELAKLIPPKELITNVYTN